METIKINNTTLEFNKIIYVDASNGSDETGDGSKNNPYKTLEKTIQQAQQNEAICLNKGSYSVRTFKYILDNLSYVSIIGNCSEIKIKSRSSGGYFDYLNFYQVVFKPDDNFIKTNHMWVNSGNLTHSFKFINCAFDGAKNKLNWFYLCFDGSSGENSNFIEGFANFINCSGISKTDNRTSLLTTWFNTNRHKILIQNCACVTDSFLGDADICHSTWQKEVTNLNNVSFDENYNIISEGWQHVGTGLNPDGTQANIGVYGGEFAWGKWLPIKYLIQDNDKIKKATMEGLEVVREGIPNVDDFEAHGTEDLADIIGNLNKKVDMIYKRDLNDKKMYGYKLIGFKDIDVLAIK